MHAFHAFHHSMPGILAQGSVEVRQCTMYLNKHSDVKPFLHCWIGDFVFLQLRSVLARLRAPEGGDVDAASLENLRLDSKENVLFGELILSSEIDEDSGLQTELACDSDSDSGDESPYDEMGTFPGGIYLPNAEEEVSGWSDVLMLFH